MGKKSFINHPSLQFISAAENKQEAVAPQTGTGSPTPAVTPTPQVTPPAQQTGTGKVEAKSRRVQILMQPGLYERARADAVIRGISFNEYVHRALLYYHNSTGDLPV